MRLRFLGPALADLDAIRSFIAQDKPLAALRVERRIRAAIELLTDFPFIGTPGVEAGTREWVVRGLPYIVIYRVAEAEDELVVIAVFDGRRLRS